MDNSSTILVVSAHAADYVWRAGGTIAKYLNVGAEVYVDVLSFGVKGESNDLWRNSNVTSSVVKAIRMRETESAAEELGINNLYFWDLDDYPMEFTKEHQNFMVRRIREIRPQVIITHERNGTDILNPDHNNVSDFIFNCSFFSNSEGV